MSLHALPSAEAQQALENQKRRSTVTSVVISLLSLSLLALLLAFLFLPDREETETHITGYWRETKTGPEPDKPKIPQRTRPSSPSASATRLLLADIPADLALPLSPQTTGESAGTGYDQDGDQGWHGDGQGPGDELFRPIQGDFKNRCSRKERLALIREAGGDPKLDDQVIRALRFLKSTQAADGGWGLQNRPAMTGLALLAYLGHCETPESEEFGESCLKAIVHLINIGQKNNGRLANNQDSHQMPYEEAIATYALAEAYGMCRNMNIPHLAESVQKAGQFLIDQQHSSGGWDYGYEENSKRGGDLSITGWHVQALHACAATGLDFKNRDACVRKALRYIETLQDQDGGFGYSNTKAAGSAPWHTLTGTGMLCLQMNDKASSSAVRKAARYVVKSAPFSYHSADCDLYAHYYLALAMFQRGGEEWKLYQARLIPALLEHQEVDGSWPLPGGGQPVKSPGAQFAQNSPTAKHYRTCLATLSLEVYYRYLKTH